MTFGKLSDERKVAYYGEPDHETDATVERENIPEDPEVGVTYRDVKVDWRRTTKNEACDRASRTHGRSQCPQGRLRR